MQPRRLSYGTAGSAIQPWPDAAPASAPRPPALARVPAGLKVALPYGRATAARARRRRVVVVATMVAVHAVAVVGLLNASRLREVVVESKPLFLAVVDTPAPVTPPQALPPPPSLKIPPPPQLQMPQVAPEPATTPSPIAAQPIAPPPPAPVAETPPPPAPAAPAAPRTIPPSAVQFLVPPAPVYSRLSAKMRESGKALVRVWIDEAGLPRDVQLVTSTGFARLDDSALAAVRNARFKPYLENGVAVAGWAAIPIEFELPQ